MLGRAELGGCRVLPAYRLYRLDGAGKISSADWIAAEADDEALRQAEVMARGASFELWDRKRLVGGVSNKGAR
jgi:hypothetical protein